MKPPRRSRSHLVPTTPVDQCPSAEPQGGPPWVPWCRMAAAGRLPRSHSLAAGRAPIPLKLPGTLNACLPLAKHRRCAYMTGVFCFTRNAICTLI